MYAWVKEEIMIEIRNKAKLVCHDLIFPILFSPCDLTSDNVSKASTAGLRNEKKKNKPGFSWQKL